MNKIEKISAGIIATLAIFGTTVFGSTGKVYNTSQGLVLRGDASKSGEPLATIEEGTQVEIIEKTGDWYKVNSNGKEGYLFAEFVKVNEAEQIANTEESITENSDEVSNSEIISDDAGDFKKNTTKKETKLYLVPVITASVIETIPENTEINVEDILNNWAYVSYNNVKGWIRTYNIKAETAETNIEPDKEEQKTTEEEQVATEQEQTNQTKTEEDTNVSFRKGYINSDSVNVRKEPNTSSEIVTTLILNTGVTITAQTAEWYKVVYGDYMGYIYKPLISEKPTATSRSSESRISQQETTPVTQETSPQEVAQSNKTSSDGNTIVEFAKKYLGYSYVYGGTTPGGGFDCSGFVYYVFNSCGYNISRSCSVQAQTGKAVSKAELQPGDIVFFNNTSNGSIGHVGIYIGGGKMIHAANPKRGVVTDTINSGYYNTYYYSARRIG